MRDEDGRRVGVEGTGKVRVQSSVRPKTLNHRPTGLRRTEAGEPRGWVYDWRVDGTEGGKDQPENCRVIRWETRTSSTSVEEVLTFSL